jgi:hypothetical protein
MGLAAETPFAAAASRVGPAPLWDALYLPGACGRRVLIRSRCGLRVLAECSDLITVEIGKEHACKFPALPSHVIFIRAGPFGNEDIPGVEGVCHREVDVLLRCGGACPIVVNGLATDDRLAERIFFVAGVASEETGG